MSGPAKNEPTQLTPDEQKRRLIAQCAVNERWGNTRQAEDNRRALAALKAARLMEQAHRLLHGDDA